MRETYHLTPVNTDTMCIIAVHSYHWNFKAMTNVPHVNDDGNYVTALITYLC